MSSSDQLTDRLLEQTRRHFPPYNETEVEITPIQKGGSGRRFYRVRSAPEQSLILVQYNLDRDENRHYVQIAEFLAQHDIRAPRVYFHDPGEGLIWMEDLGGTDLWHYRDEAWPVRRVFYESALAEVTKLHCLPIAAADGLRKDFPQEFDAPLYQWEQHYFFEHCLGACFGVEERERVALADVPALREIAERLAALPRVLVHRDFQSQNIIIREGESYLIDFQGMRPGLSKYDIASLLYDPYMSLTEAERAEIFALYTEMRIHAGLPLRSDGEELMRLCAMQRLMQALGAYGYLGLVKGNDSFLEHIKPAFASLVAVVAAIPGLEKLHAALLALPPTLARERV